MCDAYGHEMELAKLPDNSVHAESTVLEKTVHGTLKHAGFDARWQDKLMFKGDTSERPALLSRSVQGDSDALWVTLDDSKGEVYGGHLGWPPFICEPWGSMGVLF